MSQDFRFRYQQMREGDPTPAATKSGNNGLNEGGDAYPTQSNVRNLGLAWPEGRRLFLNYSYLVSGEYLPDQGLVTLIFTTHTVALKGIRLEDLFDALMGHVPRIIACAEARYNQISDNGPLINSITVTLNG